MRLQYHCRLFFEEIGGIFDSKQDEICNRLLAVNPFLRMLSSLVVKRTKQWIYEKYGIGHVVSSTEKKIIKKKNGNLSFRCSASRNTYGARPTENGSNGSYNWYG